MSEPVRVSSVFRALGDPTRAELLSWLASEGQASASRLTSFISISRQAVDRHLRVLAGAGLVTSRRSGREVLYSVQPGTVRKSAAWLEQLGHAWEEQLDLIRREAEGG